MIRSEQADHGSSSSARYAIRPAASACLEISPAGEQFATKRRKRLHLLALLWRTDRMLDHLEDLSLHEAAQVPPTWLSDMRSLLADMPFDCRLLIEGPPTPAEAIDMVFDLQLPLLRLMGGGWTDDYDDWLLQSRTTRL